MTSRDFCYWLQGSFELNNSNTLTVKQVRTIRRHLALVFAHEIDPSFPEIEALRELHTPGDDSSETPITC